MPTSSIVIIVIRMFVLHELVQSFGFLVSSLAVPLPYTRTFSTYLMHYGPVVLLLVLCAWLWKLSPWIARIACQKVEATVNLSSVTLSDLYKFSFVFLGLFFALSSIADVFNWLHYFTTAKYGIGPDRNVDNLYRISRPFLTLLAGLVCIFGAPVWTRKLLRREQGAV